MVEGGGELDDDAVINVVKSKLTDNSIEDIAKLRSDEYGADCGNEPAPEIIQSVWPSSD